MTPARGEENKRRRGTSYVGRVEDDLLPRGPGADIKPLSTDDDTPMYRPRVGDDRVLYVVPPGDVRVTEIIHRSQAVRGLD